jgi:hypothetical protein
MTDTTNPSGRVEAAPECRPAHVPDSMIPPHAVCQRPDFAPSNHRPHPAWRHPATWTTLSNHPCHPEHPVPSPNTSWHRRSAVLRHRVVENLNVPTPTMPLRALHPARCRLSVSLTLSPSRRGPFYTRISPSRSAFVTATSSTITVGGFRDPNPATTRNQLHVCTRCLGSGACPRRLTGESLVYSPRLRGSHVRQRLLPRQVHPTHP